MSQLLGLSEYVTSYDNEKVLLRTVDEYKSNGNYMHSDKIMVEKRNVTFDTDGVPMFNFRWGTHYYPITIAQYALQHHALYLVKDDNTSFDIFISMADYFVKTQDEKGGWPSDFDHTFYKGRTELMKAPWYSAMAQGQALSVLSRAYHLTREDKYKVAALKGLIIYTIPVDLGGVLRKFENKFWFYEEYPTEPASYVLNGYIYSVIGLFDVFDTFRDNLSEKLYFEGIKTLKRVLSLYDLGNRTAYDLTHYSNEGVPPNVARWGYHSTHVILMSALCCIEPNEKMFLDVFERWVNYTKGIAARTN